MPVTLVYISVKRDCIDDFITASKANHESSIEEPGNLRFDFMQNEDDPSQFVFYEWYQNDDDITAHKQTTHYKTWAAAVNDMMAERRRGVRHKGLFPEMKS
ncbi:MAG: antibiotic biosynthesis monooxygenase [Magnetovibrio sp.]|nr:antibiotic biosynthesis monooxygenase [Magnetovibrio sp.]